MASRILKLTSANSTNLTPVNPSERTTLTGYNIVNTNAAIRYVKFYWGNKNNFSSSGDVPTVGTDVPLITVLVPATGTLVGTFAASGPQGQGTMFFATTVNAADSDATAVGAGDLIISIFYE